MRHFFSTFIKRLVTILEFLITLILATGTILLIISLAMSIFNVPDLDEWPNYNDLLSVCFNLIIGVELIRMMFYHTQSNLFEVLVFAIARQIIIEHSSIWTSLVGVLSIAILFATRKYLFVKFDHAEEIVLKATMKARSVSRLLGIHIPYQNNSETLEDVFVREAKANDIEISVGAMVSFNKVGLMAVKMHDDRVKYIEIIKSAL